MANYKWKILNAEPEDYSEEALKHLRSFAEVSQIPTEQKDLISNLQGYHVLITRLALNIGEKVFAGCPELKAVVSATTGTDHIDVESARRHQVTVLCLQGEGEFLKTIPSTAEYTWALLLAVMRNIVAADKQVQSGGWDRQVLRGNNLMHKKLGILGMGRVGNQVAHYGLAFNMKVAGYDTQLSQFSPGVMHMESMRDLLSWCDILSIHIPLDSHNRGLLGHKELSWLSPGAVVINTSRGGIWEEQAVADLLSAGHLKAVATDVLDHERDADKRNTGPLLSYGGNNLLITPHIAGATFESMHMTEMFMANKLEQFLKTYN